MIQYSMAFDNAMISRQGGRSYNEDSVSVNFHKKNIFAIVADGLGGHGGGDRASALAIETIENFIEKEKSINSNNLQEAVNSANIAVNKLDGPKTTITVVYINEDTAYAAHVGDTRIYQFRDEKIIYQSQDHSVSQMAVAVGEITQDQIRNHVDRNKLLKALGNRENINAEIKELSVKKNDAFLLCTDGFWELVLEDEMLKCLEQANSAQKWLGNMILYLEKRLTEKSDNYSAAAVIV